MNVIKWMGAVDIYDEDQEKLLVETLLKAGITVEMQETSEGKQLNLYEKRFIKKTPKKGKEVEE